MKLASVLGLPQCKRDTFTCSIPYTQPRPGTEAEQRYMHRQVIELHNAVYC